jgi:His-Xaa-Ser system radical SAM maturase HxsB
MALSYFLREDFFNIPYTVNKHWIRKFDDNHFLITAEHGAWVVLSKEEYDLFRLNRVSEDLNLFKTLEEKGIIITEYNIEHAAQMFRERFPYLFNGINLHIVVPTLRCNHKCVYCHAFSKPMNAKGYDMDKKTARAVVNFIFQSPSPFYTIEFQGGEPLANFPILKFIVEYAKKKNNSKKPDENGRFIGKKDISFQIVSNFTLMNEKILDYVMENKIRLCTSLDGPKKVHDKNRIYTKGSSYEEVVYWIKFIRNEVGYKFFNSALPTISRFSLPFAKEIVDEYRKHGFMHIRMRPMNIAGLALKVWDKIGYDSNKFFNFWKEYIEYVFSLNKKGVPFFDEDSIYFLRRIITLRPPFNACLGAPCGSCLIQCAYNQWGDVYTCDEARSNEMFKLGNVKESSYKEIFTSNAALNFIGLTSCVTSLCNNCVWHPYCSPCLVSSYGAQGNLIPKLPSDFLCKIRGSQTEYLFRKLIFSDQDKKILLKWIYEQKI